MGVEPERGAHSTLQEGRHAAVDCTASDAPACRSFSGGGSEEREAVVAFH